jgi:hypothetical protein
VIFDFDDTCVPKGALDHMMLDGRDSRGLDAWRYPLSRSETTIFSLLLRFARLDAMFIHFSTPLCSFWPLQLQRDPDISGTSPRRKTSTMEQRVSIDSHESTQAFAVHTKG